MKPLQTMFQAFPLMRKSTFWRRLYRRLRETLTFKRWRNGVPHHGWQEHSLPDFQEHYFHLIAELQSRAQAASLPSVLEGILTVEDLRALYRGALVQVLMRRERLEALWQGRALRFPKEGARLPRNIQIVRRETGFELFVETNGLTCHGSKEKAKAFLGEGSNKKVLLCYRLDGEPSAWACAKSRGPEAVFTAEAEWALLKTLCHPHIIRHQSALLYLGKHKMVKHILISPLAVGTLRHAENPIVMTEREKECLMLQLLSAVSYLHGRGIVHQDLTPENVLVYDNSAGRYATIPSCPSESGWHIKLIDFGMARKRCLQEPIPSGRTAGYESPELLAYYKLKRQGNPLPPVEGGSLAEEILQRYPLPRAYAGKVTPRNDCWALGIIYYRLLHGMRPSVAVLDAKKGERHEIIHRLLSIDPANRLKAGAAYRLLKNRLRRPPSETPLPSYEDEQPSPTNTVCSRL